MTFPFPIPSPKIAAGGGAFTLDAYSPTSAHSMFRDLLSAWAGSNRYTTVTGINSLKDQTGNGHNYDQSSTTLQPAVSTAGPLSKTCADLDGTDDYLSAVHDASNYLTVGDAFIVVSCFVDTITQDSTSPYANQVVIGDNSGYLGIGLRSTGPVAEAYNFNGSFWDKPTVSISTGTALVLTWRHTGSVIYTSVNGGAESSHSSGNTASLATRLAIGHAVSNYADMKFFEMATWNSGTTPDATARAAIIAGFMSGIGAV